MLRPATLTLSASGWSLVPPQAALIVGAAVVTIVALRLFALWRGATLPRPHWLDTGKWRVP